MFILGIGSFLIVLVVLVLTLLRLSLEVRFTRIQKEPHPSNLFRRKVQYVKRIEQEKHIRYLLLISLAIGIGLVLFLSSFLLLAEEYQQMTKENTEVTERLTNLEKKHEQLVASIPLKNYPKEGIGLKEYDWKKLSEEAKDSILQDRIETEISQQAIHYFGSTDTTVSLADPNTLSLHLKGQVEDAASKETIQKNMDDFAKEAEGVSELTTIHVRMITSVGKEKNVVYSVNYSREKPEEAFKKKNVSEQNLKNDGEKG